MRLRIKPKAPKTPEELAMEELLNALDRRSSRPIAVFLGAGASKTFGYPLTRELMFEIFHGLQSGKVLNEKPNGGGEKGTRTLGSMLFEFLANLLPGERMSQKTMPMVTGVLSLLDFALATGQVLLPGSTLQETRQMRRLLERALLEVIPDAEMWAEGEEREGRYYKEARLWLLRLLGRRPAGKVAIITTNYDMMSDLLAMEVANATGDNDGWNIESVAHKVDYGFRWVHPENLEQEQVFPRPEDPRISLFKLHGSTNWLRCPLCENIYINPDGPIALLADAEGEDWDNECHCSDTQLEPQIVSPSFVREMREPNLIAIWKNALDFLREADHWLMVGYSFPDEDVAIRALMTRAYGAKRNRHPIVSVVQLDDGARVNYESFFPPTTVKYCTGGFGLLLDRAKARRVGK